MGMDNFIWIDGIGKHRLFTSDCQFNKPKIHRKDRKLCKKLKRNYYKKISNQEIKIACNGICTSTIAK